MRMIQNYQLRLPMGHNLEVVLAFGVDIQFQQRPLSIINGFTDPHCYSISTATFTFKIPSSVINVTVQLLQLLLPLARTCDSLFSLFSLRNNQDANKKYELA